MRLFIRASEICFAGFLPSLFLLSTLEEREEARAAGRVRIFPALAAVVTLFIFALPTFAQDTARHDIEIESQPIGGALKALAAQTGLQVLVFSEDAANKRSPAFRGSFTNEEALLRILGDSGLTYEKIDDNTVAIRKRDAAPESGTAPRSSRYDANSSYRIAENSQSPGDGRGAPEGKGPASSDKPTNHDSDTTSGSQVKLAEVVVSAQKKLERLQDVPVPVTALNAASLLENNQLRLQDYYTQVPGLALTTDYRGAPQVVMRGITSGYYVGNPTVAITVDDVPYTSSSSLGNGGNAPPAPDIDPNDLARIEVLRGPQGTLYGASSLGGLLKYVTVDPSTYGVNGRVEADVHRNVGDPGYGLRAAINVPISETLAVRISAEDRRDPGFIQNVRDGHYGKTDVYGGHLAALWRPSDSFSLKLSALLQRQDVRQLPFAEVDLGDLKQSNFPGDDRFLNNLQAYSAVLKAECGAVDLTAVTGYNIYSLHDTVDDTQGLGGLLQLIFPDIEAGGAVGRDNGDTRKFTQEVRASIPFGKRFEWLIGAFYTDERSVSYSDLSAANIVTGARVADFGSIVSPSTYSEMAGFTDLTVHMTNRFDVQLGGRVSQNRQTYSEVDSGLYGPAFDNFPAGPVITPETDTKDHAFTYLVTPQYTFSPALMVYARIASGYRPGGPNTTCVPFHVPCHYNPDRTKNYDIGVKGDALGSRLTFDVSVYYIDWKNIQLTENFPNSLATGYANAGNAKSQGVELALQSRPVNGLTLGVSAAYTDTVLKDGFPPAVTVLGLPGDRLPYSSRFSGSFSAQQNFTVGTGLNAFVGGTVSYVGDRFDVFLPTGFPRGRFPAYATTDLRAGAVRGPWSANLFVKNAFDRRGILATSPLTVTPAYTYIEPRTVGLSLVRSL